MKTKLEIDAEIAQLKRMKPRMRHYNAFNENNWRAMEAQVRVLQDRLNREEAYIEFSPEDSEDQSELDAALEAADWLRDANHESPSSSWLSVR